MHWIPAAHLVTRYGYTPYKGKEAAPSSPPNIAMVIFETRPVFWLPLVLKNAMDVLGHQCTLYVVAPKDVHVFIQSNEPDLAYRAIGIDAPRKISIADYSTVMLSKKFWEVFTEEHVLVFQCDCLLLRPIPPSMLLFDYVGPKCGTLTGEQFIINGGLSLRRTQAMLEAIDAMTPEEKTLPEDVAFTMCLRRLGAKLPSMDECDVFAIESHGDATMCVGIHGTDKYYCSDELLHAAISSL